MATDFAITMKPRSGGAVMFQIGSFYQHNTSPTTVCVYLGNDVGWRVGTSSVKVTMRAPAEWTEIKNVEIIIQEEIN